jgi:ribonuclease HI
MRTTPTAALEALLNLPPLHLRIEEVAKSAAFRLASIKLWTNHYKLTGHTELNKTLNKDAVYWRNSDRALPRYEFDLLFNTIIKSKDEVDLNDYKDKEDQITCFTDGSKSDLNSGSGVYIARLDTNISVSVGPKATVFQSELTAIELCADELLNKEVKDSTILICSDSQAALKSLTNNKVTSKTVWSCLQKLQQLGSHNKVTLIWVPGHCGIEGNEKADELAGLNVNQSLTDLELPISHCLIKSNIKHDISTKFQRLWSNKTDLRQSKELILTINPDRSSSLLQMNRQDLRLVVNFTTGHALVQYHLNKMHLTDDTACRLCGDGTETTKHILCDCPALMARRLQIYEKRFTKSKDLQDFTLIPKFLKNLKIKI